MKIVISGATSGIGRQLAIDYHQQGHSVCAVGRSAESLRELEEAGLETLRVDLTDRQETLEKLGAFEQVDLAILSAGNCEYIRLPDFDSALVSRVMRANVDTLAHAIEALLPALRKGERPQLVGIGSSAAYLPLPRAEAYGASKAAVAYMLETLRIGLKGYGVDVSLVCPGFVKTPLTDRNDFPMPCLIDVETASREIRKGIERRQAEIHFPKRFTYFLKLASHLPRSLWSRMAQRMVG